jgi:hypothetical protein
MREMHVDVTRVELRPRGARMLPTSMRRRRLLPPWSPHFWAQSLTAFIILFATPGAVDVVQEFVSLATGIECTDELCDEGGGQCCPNTCTQCTCCAHPNAVPSAPLLVPGDPLPEGLKLGWYSDGAYTSGYRALPFRPPAA